MCGASQKPSAKALRHVKLEAELDDVAAVVERKAGPTHNKCRKVWAMVDSGSFVTIATCAIFCWTCCAAECGIACGSEILQCLWG